MAQYFYLFFKLNMRKVQQLNKKKLLLSCNKKFHDFKLHKQRNFITTPSLVQFYGPVWKVEIWFHLLGVMLKTVPFFFYNEWQVHYVHWPSFSGTFRILYDYKNLRICRMWIGFNFWKPIMKFSFELSEKVF